MIAIELNQEEAQLFVEFQKNYKNFEILYKSGIFDLKNGHAEIHFI